MPEKHHIEADEAGEYGVKVTRFDRVSESVVPIPDLMRLFGGAPAPAASPAPHASEPLVDHKPALMRIEGFLNGLLLRMDGVEEAMATPPKLAPPPPRDPALAGVLVRLDALEARQAPAPEEAQPESEAMPSFLRGARRRGLPAAPPAAADVGLAIEAMNDIERRMQSTLEELARRVDDVSARLDMPPVDVGSLDHKREMAAIANWLRSIDRTAETQDLARRVDAIQEKIRTEQPPPADVPRPLSPMERVLAAASARRGALLGESADERDRNHRLADLAFNALSGRAAAIQAIQPLADATGVEFGELAKAYAGQHDAANRVIVETMRAEVVAAIGLQAASTPDEAERLVADAISAIERVER